MQDQVKEPLSKEEMEKMLQMRIGFMKGKFELLEAEHKYYTLRAGISEAILKDAEATHRYAQLQATQQKQNGSKDTEDK